MTNGGSPLLSPVLHTAADNDDEDCTNGEDDDADGFIDCEDGDCDSHPDCADAGGGIRIGTPGGPGLIVGWDETMGTRDIGISRGSLAVMWTENRLNHSPIACGLSGLQAVVDLGPGSSYVLASAPGGSSPDYGEDSFGTPRLAPSGPCP